MQIQQSNDKCNIPTTSLRMFTYKNGYLCNPHMKKSMLHPNAFIKRNPSHAYPKPPTIPSPTPQSHDTSPQSTKSAHLPSPSPFTLSLHLLSFLPSSPNRL